MATNLCASERARESGQPRNEDRAVANDAGFQRALTLPAGVPVLADEKVWVREWSGRGDDWQTAAAGVPAADLRFETDPRDPAVKTADGYAGTPSRISTLRTRRSPLRRRARDGCVPLPRRRRIHPTRRQPDRRDVRDRRRIEGNVAAGAIRELRSGVGFVESVTNPLAASGGAAAERLRAARDRSVQSARHRDRAVSFEDYEWLARARPPRSRGPAPCR